MMVSVKAQLQDSYVVHTLEILKTMLENYQPRNFAFRLWDGTIWQQVAGQTSHFTIVLNHPAALRRMFFPPTERRLGEAYMFGDFEIEGDFLQAMNLAKYIWDSWTWMDTLRHTPHFLRLPTDDTIHDTHQAQLTGQQHSIDRDKQAIQYHYDVSNAFYQLWLDKQMVYSCAYFLSDDEDIDKAQQNKLDYICRKLRLKPGEKLLDIGCGWGALIIHAAKHYGVDATGITLSKQQYQYANQRIADEGLDSQCRVKLMDYRNVDESQSFDKIVSIGMVEHVGRENLSIYFDKVYRLLRTGGTFLNHGITSPRQQNSALMQGDNSFMQRYVFPDGDIQSIVYVLSKAAMSKFQIRDIENLREHYALTLKHWLECLEANKNQVVKMVGEAGYRQWRIYLASSRWLFVHGLYGIHQSLLYKLDENNPSRFELPLTRSDWYLRE